MAPGGESGWRASSPRREGAAPGAVPTDPTDLLPAHRGVGAGARSSRRPRHPRAEPSERAHRPGVPAVFHPAARVAAREGAAVPHAGDWVVLPGPRSDPGASAAGYGSRPGTESGDVRHGAPRAGRGRRDTVAP